MLTISSAADLRTYLQNARGDMSDALIEAVIYTVQVNEPHPAWGADWTAWIADNLDHIVETTADAETE